MIDLPEKNKYVISSYLGGVVNDMNLINGQRVNKGQVLFRLTNPELITWQQEYIELQGQHDYLKDEYQRQKTLAEENLSARKNYLKADADLKMNEAKIAGLEKKLELLGFSPSKINTASFYFIGTCIGIHERVCIRYRRSKGRISPGQSGGNDYI